MAMKTIKEPTIVSPTESLRYTAKAEKGPSFVEVMAFNGKVRATAAAGRFARNSNSAHVRRAKLRRWS